MEAKVEVLGSLNGLLPTGDKKIDHRIEKAIYHLEKSLKPDLWEDATHLTKKGKKVFDEEKKTLHELMKVETPDVSAQINVLVSADAALAQTASAAQTT